MGAICLRLIIMLPQEGHELPDDEALVLPVGAEHAGDGLPAVKVRPGKFGIVVVEKTRRDGRAS